MFSMKNNLSKASFWVIRTSKATFTLRGGIYEKLTLLNKLYQVNESVRRGGGGGVKKGRKCVNIVREQRLFNSPYSFTS